MYRAIITQSTRLIHAVNQRTQVYVTLIMGKRRNGNIREPGMYVISKLIVVSSDKQNKLVPTLFM